MNATELSNEKFAGLSGATIGLRRNTQNLWVVRKTASSPEANQRLQRQAQKQSNFSHNRDCPLKTPRIFCEGEIDGRYYFEMEYIRGLDAASFLRQATYADVVNFADQLANYVDFAAEQPAVCDSTARDFFEALYDRLCRIQLQTHQIPGNIFGSISLSLDRLRRMRIEGPTLCHGDLTLANLIVDSYGKMWAVDLLDSPFEHYWQDIAKLHQDLAGCWFLVDHPPVAQCVLNYVSSRVMQKVVSRHPEYAEVHSILLAVTFARILPYVKTDEQLHIVQERLQYFAGLHPLG